MARGLDGTVRQHGTPDESIPADSTLRFQVPSSTLQPSAHTIVTDPRTPDLEPPESEAGESAEVPGFWSAVRASVRGTHHADYTSAPLTHAIILLSVPMVLEMVMESVFAVVDIFFVSRLGPSAVAEVGLTESMMTLVYTVALGLSIGVTAGVLFRRGKWKLKPV